MGSPRKLKSSVRITAASFKRIAGDIERYNERQCIGYSATAPDSSHLLAEGRTEDLEQTEVSREDRIADRVGPGRVREPPGRQEESGEEGRECNKANALGSKLA